MRNFSIFVLVFVALSTLVRTDNQYFHYHSEKGFILYYPLPADDADRCNIKSVVWNNPFVAVRWQEAQGISNDAIVIEAFPSLSIFDVSELSLDKDEGSLAHRFFAHAWEDVKGAFTGKFNKEQQEELNKRVEVVKKRYQAQFDSPKILDTLYFSQITGFSAPDIEKGQGVCLAFKGFATTDLVLLFN